MNQAVSTAYIALLVFLFALASGVDAFLAPSSALRTNQPHQQQQRLDTRQFINVGEKERDALTRDSEPEDFFAT